MKATTMMTSTIVVHVAMAKVVSGKVLSKASQSRPAVINITSQQYRGYNSTMDFSGLVETRATGSPPSDRSKTLDKDLNNTAFTFHDPVMNKLNFTADDKTDAEFRKSNPVWQEMMRNAHTWATKEARKNSGNFNKALTTALSNVPISEAYAWVTLPMTLNSLTNICTNPETKAIYDPRITNASNYLDLGYVTKDSPTPPKDVTDNGELPEAYKDSVSACAADTKSHDDDVRKSHADFRRNPIFTQRDYEKNLNPIVLELVQKDERRTFQKSIIQLSIKIRPTTMLRKDRFLAPFDSKFKNHAGDFVAKRLGLQLTHAAMDVGGVMTDFGAQDKGAKPQGVKPKKGGGGYSEYYVGINAGERENDLEVDKLAVDTLKNSDKISDSASERQSATGTAGAKKKGGLKPLLGKFQPKAKAVPGKNGRTNSVKDRLRNSVKKTLLAKTKKGKRGQYHVYQYRKFYKSGSEIRKRSYIPWVVEVLGEVDLTRKVRHVSLFARQMIRDFLTLKENQNEYGVYRNRLHLETRNHLTQDGAHSSDSYANDAATKDVKTNFKKRLSDAWKKNQNTVKKVPDSDAWNITRKNCQHYVVALASYAVGAKGAKPKVTVSGKLLAVVASR